MTIKKRIATFVLLLALIFTIGGEVALSPFLVKAEAATSSHSNVLDDLSKDKNFDANSYPTISDDYSLQVIQIAEGENGELFVYVYQPSDATKDYKAKYINMSLESIYEYGISYKLYSLTWLNSEGVFDKYIVNDFTVKNIADRYYSIAAIYRQYDASVDTSSEAIDTIQCKGYEVGQCWRVYYYNDALIYEMEKINVVDIDVHATGSVRYFEGLMFGFDSCDSHYVAFSVENFNVEKIYDADIVYTVDKYSYRFDGLNESNTLVNSITYPKTLSEIDTVTTSGYGLFGKKYTWNRIQDVTTFMKQAQDDANETFTETELEGLMQSEFVFRFAETDYFSTTMTGNEILREYSIVSDIGILRLHFLAEGKVYNLGCVSDLVGTDVNPELDVSAKDNLINEEWFEKIMMLLGLILIVVIALSLYGPVGAIFRILGTGSKFIFDAILEIILIPFKLIGSLFKRGD